MIKERTHRAKCIQMKWGESAKGFKIAEVKFEIVEGDDIGSKIFKELPINEKNTPYTKRDLMTLGWFGGDTKDAPVQIADATAGGLVVDIEVEHVNWQGGKPFPAVRRIGEITTKTRPLNQDEIKDLNDAFKSVPVERKRDDVPPIDDNDIPF